MNRIIALVLTIVSLGLTACIAEDPRSVEQRRNQVVLARETEAPTETIQKLIEEKFLDYKSRRNAGTGWAKEIKPGDHRESHDIEIDLSMLGGFLRDLEGMPQSAHVGNLQKVIQEAMFSDLKLLLRVADKTQDIHALSAFLLYAPDLDLAPPDFDTTTEKLRANALKFARAEVIRQRTRPTEGTPIADLLREWQFTPQELGLTEAETRTATER